MARYGISPCPRSPNRANTPCHGWVLTTSFCSSVSGTSLLRMASGIRLLPKSCSSPAMPRSYNCSLVSPIRLPIDTLKMQTFTE